VRTLHLAIFLLFTACSHGPGLGERCEATADCANQLTCGQKDATKTVGTAKPEDYTGLPGMAGACTAACNRSADCADFGKHAYCSGANICLRGCAQDADCPAMTYCRDHTYCAP
jgi:hypothetical protein